MRVAPVARILPLLGVVLLSMPLLWSGDGSGVLTSRVMLYVFGVWIFLIALSVLWGRSGDPREHRENDSATKTGQTGADQTGADQTGATES